MVMENNQQKNNIIDKVLGRIKKGDVKMKPKVYFVLKTILTVGGVFVVGAFALFLISFIFVILVAFAIRTYDYNREAGRFDGFVPFTLESAMMYSYAREIAEKGCLPDKDKALAGMDDLSINRQMSISMEYFLGYGYRLKSLIFNE